MKSSAEIFNAINALEQRFSVSAWRAGDIDLWPTYRFRLYGNAISRTLQNDPPAGGGGRLGQLFNRAARALWRVPVAARRDRRSNASVEPGMAAVFFSDGMSFTRLGDTWFDRVMDPLMLGLEQRGHRSVKLTPLAEVHIPRQVPSRFVQPAIDRIKLTASLRKVSVTLPQFTALHAAAVELFGDIAPSAQWVGVQAARLSALSEWFGRVLSRSGARHAFVNTYYSLEGQAFVLAARRLGIRSIDVQHGIQGPHHVAYGRWAALPERGYSTLPDEFWVWGAEEAGTIDAWRSVCMTHVPRVTGNFWLQRWRDDTDPVVMRYVQQAQALRNAQPGTTRVLVCLTWGVPESETEKLIEAAKLCGPNIAWWWRLHPVYASRSGEFARRIAQHGLDATQVEQATHLPLYALLRAADVSVAHSSTTIREAAEFGMPSVVTSDYGVELHGDLVRSGFVRHAVEPHTIAEAVMQLAARQAGVGVKAAESTALQSLLDTDFPRGSAMQPRHGAAA